MLLAVALSLALGADAPWEGEPFAADPSALIRAATALGSPPAGVELDLLLEDLSISFDEGGRATQTWRLVYRPLTAGAARDLGTTSITYAPWHQARPEIRVRVVRPDGEVHWLDPGTLSDSPAIERRPEVFSDWRTLRAPIPGVGKDVVVEETIRIHDTEPFFEAGSVTRVAAWRNLPARRWRVRVEAPRRLPLRHEEVALPKPRETTAGGRRILSWDVSPLEAATPVEPFAPRDRAWQRHLEITTARSWQEVARAYAAIADRQLSGADLAATAREIVSPGDSTAVAARKILAWISSRVRYTGLELGDAGIVPARPAEVLSRRYGDCKDLSLLAVGLLRAAGHAAHLALVRMSWEEVLPGLPGFGVFDHAIVRVGGRSPVWLDPTTPDGEISSEEEGRLALVVDAETKGLTRTPERVGSDNRILKIRRILLSEYGVAKAVEETEGWGIFAAQVRGVSQGVNQAEREGTARQRLAAPEGAAVRVRYEPRAAPAATLVQVMEADASRWGTTREDEAEATVSVHPLFWNLPAIFRTDALERGAEDRDPPPRKQDVLLPMAFQAELRYLVMPPPGFQTESLPEGERVSLGPATYQSAFAAKKDGAIAVSYRFDVGRRQLTPSEFQQMWRGVAQRTREEGPRIRFRRTSRVLLAAGKGREALDEIRRLITLHPREVDHRIHLALALLQLGLGDAARAEAHRAVEMEPGSEWAWRVLSSVVSHDLLGRPLRSGADLDGAIAAQRRARDLAPRAAGIRARLAALLELAPDLERFAQGSRLGEALAEYRFVHEDLGSRDHDVDYALALFHAGRPAEALRLARAAPRSPERDAVALAAGTLVEGPEAALRGAADWDADGLVKAATQASRELIRSDHYAEASRLIEGMGTGAAVSTPFRELLSALARTRHLATLADDRSDPARLPHRFFQAAAAGDPVAAMKNLFATHIRSMFGEPVQVVSFRSADLQGFGTRANLDILAGLLEVRVEGDGPPWRLHAKARGKGDLSLVFLATREDGEARLLSIQALPSEYGAEALRSARSGDLASARRLLGWAREALGKAEPGAWSAAGVLAALWSNEDAAGAEELRRAAAALAAFGSRGSEGLPLLAREWASSPGGAPHRGLSYALLHALGKGDGVGVDSAIAAAERIGSEYPEIGHAVFQAKVEVLRRGGRNRELQTLAEARLRAKPRDLEALRARYSAADVLGDMAGVGEAARAILASGNAEAADLNNTAWSLLFETPVPPEALDAARRAVEKSATPAALHTLATAEAMVGGASKAMEALRQRAVAGLEGADWLVVGLLAERYGALEAARAAYRRVTPPAKPSATSSSVLARRRLATMDANRAP